MRREERVCGKCEREGGNEGKSGNRIKESLSKGVAWIIFAGLILLPFFIIIFGTILNACGIGDFVRGVIVFALGLACYVATGVVAFFYAVEAYGAEAE